MMGQYLHILLAIHLLRPRFLVGKDVREVVLPGVVVAPLVLSIMGLMVPEDVLDCRGVAFPCVKKSLMLLCLELVVFWSCLDVKNLFFFWNFSFCVIFLGLEQSALMMRSLMFLGLLYAVITCLRWIWNVLVLFPSISQFLGITFSSIL